MKPDVKKLLLTRYEEYKKMDPEAIRYALAWYRGWHRRENTEEEKTKERSFTTS